MEAKKFPAPVLVWSEEEHQEKEIIVKAIHEDIELAKIQIIHNLISPESCNKLLAAANGAGFDSAFGETKKGGERGRDNSRVTICSPTFADYLFQKIKHLLPPKAYRPDPESSAGVSYLSPLSKKGEGEGEEFAGEPIRVNDELRIERYLEDQQFRIHRDANKIVKRESDGFYHMTLFSVVLYLNDGAEFEGGRTNFVVDRPGAAPLGVVPQKGSAVVFRQELLHEGATVSQGVKFVLRTDVLYRFRERKTVDE
eukprot:TRINITY_DN8443_c0_g1_i1.p1 TRINITY_DN8443_c0_g1~~TRINITY_DN8443_c0_g1_i1.p1  ORF type:complete len:254 (-),score=53.22 TRINITY_DN8443_c0_g1_i1:17-778(-)